MKLYLHRFIHHIGGLPDFRALKVIKYNQYESLVLPLCKWLLEQGVIFRYGVEATDIDFDIKRGRKQVTGIHWLENGIAGSVELVPTILFS
ncbi:myosin-crossreactive antigen [Bradyrhizobium sp. ERR14]|nr:myosin-crossreactive antigen [Bradyrhizobium sp. ERR14]